VMELHNWLECKEIKFLNALLIRFSLRLHTIHDPSKDKSIELEMGWISEETSWIFSHVPQSLLSAAEKEASNVTGETTAGEEMAVEETKS
jgi:hypothetical protein